MHVLSEHLLFIFFANHLLEILEDMTTLQETLAAIELRLHDELYHLKQMIRSLMPQEFYRQPPPRQDYYNPHQGANYHNSQQQYHQQAQPPIHHHNNIQQSFYDTSSVRSVASPKNVTSKPPISTTENIFTASFTKSPEVVNVARNHLKSFDSGRTKPFKNVEITTLAPTTTSMKSPPTVLPKNEFTFYWKLENFPKVFRHAKKNEVYSHVFNVRGLFLRIRASLQILENQNLILDIEHLANVENADKIGIEISDGLVFKEIAEEKLFQYSFAIMDQTNPDHDLISPIYWNTDVDHFLVPGSVHLLANYVKNESLLVKLIIMF